MNEEQAEPWSGQIWHGLPKATWFWSAYNVFFVGYCTYHHLWAPAILIAVMAVWQVVMGARLAYWTEQEQLERQREQDT